MGSRAITSDMISELCYAINLKSLPSESNQILWPIQQTSHKDRALDDWGGARARALAHLATFVCLLRSDEVHNLRMEDIALVSPNCISINITSRKTPPLGKLYHVDCTM